MSDGEWYGGGNVMLRSSSVSPPPPGDRDHGYRVEYDGGKRPLSPIDYLDIPDDYEIVHQSKRPRYTSLDFDRASEPAFFVLREARQPSSVSPCGYDETDPVYAAPSVSLDRTSTREVAEVREYRFLGANLRRLPVERTSTGLSITPDDEGHKSTSCSSDLREDDLAATRVERHLSKYSKCARNSTAERILKSLISPRSSPGAEFEIDNAALQSIFHAANEIFFYGCLKGRVRWDWSDSSNEKYHSQLIGTTALREADNGGYETLIVLSHHYLKDKRYNRRLLISTFLHELIHSYLFVQCGFKARRSGGHTDGFHRIARLIDKWAGPDTLFLGNMEADLDDFRLSGNDSFHRGFYHKCGMQCPEDFDGIRQAIPNAGGLSYVNWTGWP
jgi:hypothetical protein